MNTEDKAFVAEVKRRVERNWHAMPGHPVIHLEYDRDRFRLVALVEALGARLTVTPETVERAARAIWAFEHAQPWDELGRVQQGFHLESARLGLVAAIGSDDDNPTG